MKHIKPVRISSEIRCGATHHSLEFEIGSFFNTVLSGTGRFASRAELSPDNLQKRAAESIRLIHMPFTIHKRTSVEQ